MKREEVNGQAEITHYELRITHSAIHLLPPTCERSERTTSYLKRKECCIIQTQPQSQPTALSAPALARSLAPGALSRVGRIALDEKTEPKVVLTAAKLILWATGLSEPPGEGEQELELRFSPEDADGD